MTTETLRTITVRELIEDLAEQDPEMLVAFTSDYGDIGHTPQVHAIKGVCQEETIEETAYSVSGWAVQEGDDPEDRDDEAPVVLVIR
jgi:hypothetical protein